MVAATLCQANALLANVIEPTDKFNPHIHSTVEWVYTVYFGTEQIFSFSNMYSGVCVCVCDM